MTAPGTPRFLRRFPKVLNRYTQADPAPRRVASLGGALRLLAATVALIGPDEMDAIMERAGLEDEP